MTIWKQSEVLMLKKSWISLVSRVQTLINPFLWTIEILIGFQLANKNSNCQTKRARPFGHLGRKISNPGKKTILPDVLRIIIGFPVGNNNFLLTYSKWTNVESSFVWAHRHKSFRHLNTLGFLFSNRRPPQLIQKIFQLRHSYFSLPPINLRDFSNLSLIF